jgi:hypothetical protein
LLQKLLDSPALNQSGVKAYPVIDYILQSQKKLDGVGAYSMPFCSNISSHKYAKSHVNSLRTFPVPPVKLKNGSVACLWCMHSHSLLLIEKLVILKNASKLGMGNGTTTSC